MSDNSCYKLISFDLDGTLLDNNLKISNYTKKNLKKLIKKNIICIINSSRPIKSILSFINNIEFSYISGLNGAVIYNNTEKIIEKTEVMKECPDLIDFIFKKNITANIYTKNNIYITKTSDNIINKKFQLSLKAKNLKYIKAEEKILSIELILNDEFEKNKIYNFIKKKYKNIEVKKSSDNFLEINDKNIDKSNALKFITQRLNIPLNKVIALGDSESDLSVLKIAGLGVIMKNSDKKMRRFSYSITEEDNNNNGAIKFILNKINIE